MIDLDTDIKTAIQCRNGVLTIKRTQDVQPILDLNKAAQAAQVGGWRRASRGNIRYLAEIPNIVIEAWLKEGFNALTAPASEIRKKLDDPNWSYLKQIPGRIGQRKRHI